MKSPCYQIPRSAQARREPFGGLISVNRGPIVRLDRKAYSLWTACREKALPIRLLEDIARDDLSSAALRLKKAGLVTADGEGIDSPWSQDALLAFLAGEEHDRIWPTRSPPLWAHIQPFTICNQHCIHCYCSGGPDADKPILAPADWKGIVDRLTDIGVFEIYLTGGEVFASNLTVEIVDYILDKGIATGLSTNASIIRKSHLDWISSRKFSIIQVSLDGATALVHDDIRGQNGAFEATLRGINALKGVVGVIINCVVNARNRHQIPQIASLAESLGAVSIKFFPQKLCGRAAEADCLTREEWLSIPFQEIARDCAIPIEAPTAETKCSSGHSGLAIDQHGYIYPCIFAVDNASLRCGHILRDDLRDVWMKGQMLDAFRKEPRDNLCSRCERKATKS